ncbi:MAG: hypothetical protein AMJ92_03595 [candidate division Zixibacteria bacterium SM23_81]|nr:MAG: hypothetical protein AMJ92_03595 [candidate division Zixibacteria bacterium SM23_81]
MKRFKLLIFSVLLITVLVCLQFLPFGQTWAGQRGQKYMSAEQTETVLKSMQVNPDRKAGIHAGNRVRTRFTNFGSIGRYAPRIEWPAYSGHEYGYEFGPIVAAEFVRWDSVNAEWDTVHCSIEGILDGGDDDLEPLPGFFAPLPNESPAMSDDPTTWPPEWEVWPGQFGEGVITADQESYFVMDDQANNAGEGGGNAAGIYDYYPDDDDLQGLAIEISSRGYQWAAAIAEDIIFFVYEIKNMGYRTLDKVVAGYFVDLDVGGYPDFADDGVDFEKENNFVYSWDTDNTSPNFPGDVGWIGFKYLESPYNDHDGIDNDGDGLVDESQYNDQDEDGDWDLTDEEAQQDTNDVDELSDDIGADGIPGTGDEGEGDGQPSQGEPDFGIRDIDESDYLGMTSMMSYDYNSPYYAGNDSTGWIALTPGSFSDTFPVGDNVFFFGSGYFSLQPGESQPMSIAIIVGADSVDLWNNAEIAQTIYELGYQFTKAPFTPHLTAVAGDGEVTLYWDNIAEKSVDPLLGPDFEGYTIYRSTDRGATWGNPITDNRGVQVYWEPIAQFDLVDSVLGSHPLDHLGKQATDPKSSGVHYYMGDDTGLAYSWMDRNVTNGIRYYYAICSYDIGSVVDGIPPVECAKAIKNPDLITEPNVVSVVPNAKPLGYVAPEILQLTHQGNGDAAISIEVLDPQEITGHSYRITFDDTTAAWMTFSVLDESLGDSVIIENSASLEGQQVIFDGLDVTIDEIDNIDAIDSLHAWLVGDCNYDMSVQLYPFGGVPYPADYEIRFFDTVVDTSQIVQPQPVKFQVWNVSEDVQSDFIFFDKDGDFDPDSYVTSRDQVLPVIYQGTTPKGTWEITFTAPEDSVVIDTIWIFQPDSFIIGPVDTIVTKIDPQAGDVAFVEIAEPLTTEDQFTFTTQMASTASATENLLDQIKVVPNPYVSAAKWETLPPDIPPGHGRGERRIDFIHLPRKCTIRIFTISGDLVRVIEHEEDLWDGSESWNLLSKDDMDVAYGIYIYHIESDIGEKIGKFAIIK